jgi:uncharacterized membrane protein YkoI
MTKLSFPLQEKLSRAVHHAAVTRSNTLMNIRIIAASLAAGALLAGCASEPHHSSLQAQAKISRADAEKTALNQVPGGIVKEGELEKENGRVIWSFDVAVPASNDIKEVAIDAVTGQVISVDTETPKQRVKEAAEDAKKEKQEKD